MGEKGLLLLSEDNEAFRLRSAWQQTVGCFLIGNLDILLGDDHVGFWEVPFDGFTHPASGAAFAVNQDDPARLEAIHDVEQVPPVGVRREVEFLDLTANLAFGTAWAEF